MALGLFRAHSPSRLRRAPSNGWRAALAVKRTRGGICTGVLFRLVSLNVVTGLGGFHFSCQGHLIVQKATPEKNDEGFHVGFLKTTKRRICLRNLQLQFGLVGYASKHLEESRRGAMDALNMASVEQEKLCSCFAIYQGVRVGCGWRTLNIWKLNMS